MSPFRPASLCLFALGLLAATPLSPGMTRPAPAPAATAKDRLVGRWRLAAGPAWAAATVAVEFTRDGKTRTAGGGESREGGYELDGDRLTLLYTGADGRPGRETVTVVRLTDAELHLRDGKGVEWRLARVPAEARGTFVLKGLALPTVVRHGRAEVVEVGVEASRDFDQDIRLAARVEPADKGVTAAVKPAVFKAGGRGKVEVEVKASEKAAAGEYTLTITAKPARGREATLGLKVRVPEKK